MNTNAMSGLASFSYATPYADAALQPSAPHLLGKGEKAAREFEAQLIGSVLEKMEQTFATVPGGEGVAGEDELSSLGSQALATAMAAGGGFGIAHLIAAHLEARR
jgi:Rod binding domain-containing protein